MGDTFVMLREVVCALVAVACVLLIISPRVPTGIVCTAGLTAMAVGTLASLDAWASPFMALDTMIGGAGVCAAGVLFRAYLAPGTGPLNRGRRQTDWMPTRPDEESGAEEAQERGR